MREEHGGRQRSMQGKGRPGKQVNMKEDKGV